MATHHELSYDCVIPSAILINENIELAAVKLYAFIKGLTKMAGYCFATNDYLASLMKADPSSIKRWLGMLKKEGYLEVETEKNGVHWQRRMYISDKFKKCLRRLTDEPPPAYGCAPPSLPVSPITKEYTNEDNLREREASPTLPAVVQFKRVKMDLVAYGKLKMEFGKEKIQEMLERLDEYADLNPKRFKQYADHATVIRKWIREDKNKPQSKEAGNVEKNGLLARNVMMKFPFEVSQQHIRPHAMGLLFCYGSVYDLIKFDEFGFRDRVLSRLQKMNLPTNEL
jgi:DNA-binding PadR family transcriptional regulator